MNFVRHMRGSEVTINVTTASQNSNKNQFKIHHQVQLIEIFITF
jgi:hypothetical protein